MKKTSSTTKVRDSRSAAPGLLDAQSEIFILTQRINDAHELLDIMGAPRNVAPDCDSKLTIHGRMEWVRENYRRI